MDTGKKTDTSTGNSFTTSPTKTLANESGSAKAVKPSHPARTKPVSGNSLKTLADVLSLLQEDFSQLQKTLAKLSPLGSVQMQFSDKGGVFYIPSIPGHVFSVKAGHILLDGIPVTGWVADTSNTGEL